MKYIIVLLTTLFTVCVQAKQIKVAVIDSGIRIKDIPNVTLCDAGHKDFTDTGLQDDEGSVYHGTNIAGIINDTAKSNYCIVVIKAFSSARDNKLEWTVDALKWAMKMKVDIINYSGGSTGYSRKEEITIKKALNSGIHVIAAAGNENLDLDVDKYYPASYDKRIIVVGNGSQTKDYTIKYNKTNYGSIVDIYVSGRNITALGITHTGSSQSTAIVTGLIVNKLNKIKTIGMNN